MSSTSSIRYAMQPSDVCMFDQPIKTTVSGLQKHANYTIVAQCKLDKDDAGFRSYAHFQADANGVIDLDVAESLGGTYEGVDPMGLVVSMKSLLQVADQFVRARHQQKYENYCRTMRLHFQIFGGHIDLQPTANMQEAGEPLARASIKRLVKPSNINRTEVRQGRVRGVLYTPKRDTVLPGVITLGGYTYPNEMYENAAATFSGHGYISLALAFIDYDDLPGKDNMELEYFLEAINWFYSLPTVKKCGIVISSACVGSALAVLLTLYCPLIKGVVTRNASSYVFDGTLRYSGKVLTDASSVITTRTTTNNISQHVLPANEDWTIPVEKSANDVRFLFICGEADTTTPPAHSWELAKRLDEAGRRNSYKMCSYPGVGHVFKGPYSPARSLISAKKPGLLLNFGGEAAAYYKASVLAWKEELAFVAQVLSTSKL